MKSPAFLSEIILLRRIFCHEEAGMLFGLTQNGKVFFHAKADGTVFVRPGGDGMGNGWWGGFIGWWWGRILFRIFFGNNHRFLDDLSMIDSKMEHDLRTIYGQKQLNFNRLWDKS